MDIVAVSASTSLVRSRFTRCNSHYLWKKFLSKEISSLVNCDPLLSLIVWLTPSTCKWQHTPCRPHEIYFSLNIPLWLKYVHIDRFTADVVHAMLMTQQYSLEERIQITQHYNSKGIITTVLTCYHKSYYYCQGSSACIVRYLQKRNTPTHVW